MKYIITNNEITAIHTNDQDIKPSQYNDIAEIIKTETIYPSDYIFTDEELQTLRAQTLLQKKMTPFDFVKGLSELGVLPSTLWQYLQTNNLALLALFTCDRIYRGDESLANYAEALNVTSAQLDELFNAKGNV